MSDVQNQNATNPIAIACPSCRRLMAQPESGVDFQCADCDVTYPALLGRVPVLVSDPASHLAGERARGVQFASQYRAVSDQYSLRTTAGGARVETLKQLSAGLLRNAELLETLCADLPFMEQAGHEYSQPLGGDLFATLRRDWSGEAECEAEIKVMREAALELIDVSQQPDTVVLGAGTGRLLAEFCEQIPSITGLDLSTGMGMLYARLAAGEQFSICQLLNGNFYRAADESQIFELSHSRSAGRPRYIIANATQMPFADDCCDLVIAINFVDMVPTSKLLPEIRRVLRPRGKLVFCGPLGYAFDDFGEYFAVDQLLEVWQSYGFEIQHQDCVRNTHYADSRRMTELTINNLRLLAKLQG